MTLSPEIELMLCGAGVHIEPEVATRMVVLLQGELDWSFLLRMALRHRLVPLLHQSLSQLTSGGIDGVKCAPGCLPADVRRLMLEHSTLTLRRNLFLTGQLFSILDSLKEQDIFAVPYKGPVQAYFLYGNLTSRQFMDLDILVVPSDAPRALELLLARGFVLPKYWSTGHSAAFLEVSQRHECALYNPTTGVAVELHWRTQGLQFSSELTASDLQSNLRDFQFQGRSIPLFAPEDLLLLLCSHGERHLWYRLHWLCDLAQLLRTQPLNWKLIVKRTRQSGNYRGLLLSLSLAESLLKAPLPKELGKLVQTDALVQELASQISRDLFFDEPGTAGSECLLLRLLNGDIHVAPRSGALLTTVSLPLANHLMGAALPSSIAQYEMAGFSDLTAQLRNSLTRDSEIPGEKYNATMLAMRERVRDKIRFVWWTWLAPGEKELAALRLPRGLRFLSLPFRCSRLIFKYGSNASFFKKIFYSR